MAKLEILNLKGEKVKDITLNKDIWNIEVNEIAVKKAIDLQMASLRQGSQKAKTRAEVRGGGRKPYRQKGTGNARAGSNTSPIWRGGGMIFAVSPRDYTFKMNKKEKTLALKSALTIKAKEKALMVVDTLEFANLKTKEAKAILANLKLDGKLLFVSNSDAENLYMATRNLGTVTVIMASEVNVYDLIHNDKVIFEESALNHIEEVLNNEI